MIRRRRKKNPTTKEVLLYAAGTSVGIVIGTVVATWLVESLRAGGYLPSSGNLIPQSVPLNSAPSPSPSTSFPVSEVT